MLKDADYFEKNDRHGKKGNNWEDTHQFFIGEWGMRNERFDAILGGATMYNYIPLSLGYMTWYNRITMTYLTQPGVQSTIGMNETASAMRLFVSLLY